MKVVLMRLAVIVLRIIYIPFMPLRMKNKITILSRQSNKRTVDIMLLEKDLKSKNVETAVLTKRLIKNLWGGIKYAFHMLRQMYHIATSKVIVIDGYCILVSVLKKKEGQQVVQIWHSLGAIKKFGYQSIGKAGGNKVDVVKTMKLYKKYDYVIAPSEIMAEFYSEAFDINRDKIKLYGLPRIDYLKDENKDITDKIYSDYPQLMKKPNVIYMPTFRKNGSVDVKGLIDIFDFDKYNLIIRKHWLDKTDYRPLESKGMLIGRGYNSMDWLKVADKVITDYSAAAFEAAILEKELYFYMPDIEEYERNIGINVDLMDEEIHTYVYTKASALCAGLEANYDKSRVRRFKEKYVSTDTKDCTDQLGAFFIALMD